MKVSERKMIRFFRPTIEEIFSKRGEITRDIKFSVNTQEMRQDNDLLFIKYNFLVDYGGAKIEIKGEIVGKGEKEEIEKFINYWKENKKIHNKLFVMFYNILITSLFNKIALICETLSLPLPINLPIIREKEKVENEENKEEKKELIPKNKGEDKEENKEVKIDDIE